MNTSFSVKSFHSERGCLSYLLTDTKTNEAALIDASMEIVDEYRDYLKANPNVKIVRLIETHTHADHISAAKILRNETGAKIVMSEHSPSPSKDRGVKDEDEIVFGQSKLTVWQSFGHTNESLAFVADGMIFSGDTLLIGGTGRTDFQLGESEALYKSLERILTLPDETIVYPGHNYVGKVSSTIGEERTNNTRLQSVVAGDKEKFVEMMNAYQPPLPELFRESLRENSL